MLFFAIDAEGARTAVKEFDVPGAASPRARLRTATPPGTRNHSVRESTLVPVRRKNHPAMMISQKINPKLNDPNLNPTHHGAEEEKAADQECDPAAGFPDPWRFFRSLAVRCGVTGWSSCDGPFEAWSRSRSRQRAIRVCRQSRRRVGPN